MTSHPDFQRMMLEFVDTDKLVRQMYAAQYSFKEIGDVIGLSRKAARRYAVKLGVIKANTRTIVAPRVRTLILEGKSPKQVASAIGCHPSQVYQQRRELILKGAPLAPLPSRDYSDWRYTVLRSRWSGRTNPGPKGMRYRKIQQLARHRSFIAVIAPLDESCLYGSALDIELELVNDFGRVDGSKDDWRVTCVVAECLRFDRKKR